MAESVAAEEQEELRDVPLAHRAEVEAARREAEQEDRQQQAEQPARPARQADAARRQARHLERRGKGRGHPAEFHHPLS